MPGTVEELLAARIDRRPTEEKRLLQLAAVVGKDVSLPVLARVAGVPVESLEPQLRQLQAAEFLYEKADSAEPQYSFRHALTHEAAYGILLESDRRAIHVLVLEAMEALYAPRLQEHVEALGHHALRGEHWDKAVDYLRRAGAKAFGRSTNREAVSYLEEALTALRRLPAAAPGAGSGDLRFELRNALQPLGEFQAMRQHLVEAQEAAAALGDPRRLGRAAAYLADHFRLTGDHAKAIEWGERAHDIAASLGDLALQVNATTYLGQIHLIRGDYRRAIGINQVRTPSFRGAPDCVEIIRMVGPLDEEVRIGGGLLEDEAIPMAPGDEGRRITCLQKPDEVVACGRPRAGHENSCRRHGTSPANMGDGTGVGARSLGVSAGACQGQHIDRTAYRHRTSTARANSEAYE